LLSFGPSLMSHLFLGLRLEITLGAN
jgi:hypothetical protein